MSHILSMTGFATSSKSLDNLELTCEIRSLNSRYLEMIVKLPRILADSELPVKELIRKKLTRGKVTLTITLNGSLDKIQKLRINPGTVKMYADALEQIKAAAGLSQPLTMEQLLSFKEIISIEEGNEFQQELEKQLLDLVNEALDKLLSMRAQEGANLRDELLNQLRTIDTLRTEISEYAAKNPELEFERLHQRLLKLVDESKIDRDRLEQELALISDKVDITEELVRLKSHIELFAENLKKGSPVGKKLNFILQEMHREANTMSNKTTMVEISHRVVTLKEIIEIIREQVQNIE